MTTSVVHLTAEKAIQNKEIDIVEFAKDLRNKEYYNCYSSNDQGFTITTKANLSEISDELLLRRLVLFVWSQLTSSQWTPTDFQNCVFLPLVQLLQLSGDSEKHSYPRFLAQITCKLSACAPEQKWRINHFADQFKRFCAAEDGASTLYSGDVWKAELRFLTPERLNPSRQINSLNFKPITDERNKDLAKAYVKYLLLNTDQTLKYIRNQLSDLKQIFALVDKPYEEWKTTDALCLAECFKEKNIKDNTKAQYILTLEAFTDYLLLHDFIKENPVVCLRNLSRYRYEYKISAASEYVIQQIFDLLPSIKDESLVLRFLLIYCTGMRISEASSMKKDCLERTGKNCFVRYYQNKMKKWVNNVIPERLYEMIDEYRKTLARETQYLFPNPLDQFKPIPADSFVKKMQPIMGAARIENPDGSPYVFTAHSFRHLMAVRMREENIPFQFIQEQLHHESPEMTLAYTEFQDRAKMAKMKGYINIHGEKTPLSLNVPLANKEEYEEAVKKFVHAQTLPNGLCTRPTKLAKCSHTNACLKCSHYRTSAEFLSVHEKHLLQMDDYISLADRNGWLMQASDARNTKETLIRIIDALKGEQIKDEN